MLRRLVPHAPRNEWKAPTNQRSRIQNVVVSGTCHSWGRPLLPAEPGPHRSALPAGSDPCQAPGGPLVRLSVLGAISASDWLAGAFGALSGSDDAQSSRLCRLVALTGPSMPGVDRGLVWEREPESGNHPSSAPLMLPPRWFRNLCRLPSVPCSSKLEMPRDAQKMPSYAQICPDSEA